MTPSSLFFSFDDCLQRLIGRQLLYFCLLFLHTKISFILYFLFSDTSENILQKQFHDYIFQMRQNSNQNMISTYYFPSNLGKILIFSVLFFEKNVKGHQNWSVQGLEIIMECHWWCLWYVVNSLLSKSIFFIATLKSRSKDCFCFLISLKHFNIIIIFLIDIIIKSMLHLKLCVHNFP